MFTLTNAWGTAKRLLFVTACLGVIGVPDALAQEPTGTLRAVPSALLSIDQNRTTVIDRIVADWGDALAQSGAGITVEQLRATLSAMRADYLLAASIAGSLDGLRNVVASSLIGAKPDSTKLLGDTTDDLVYTPVVPCRLVDTRNAGGQIGGFSSRDFKVWVSSGGFTAQGGDASNCNIPANPSAVVANLTAVSPAGAGNLIIYPFGSAAPLSSALSYQAGTLAVANAAIVKACVPNCTNQVTVAANGAGTDFVMDVTGYFAAPVATALQCTPVVSASTTIPFSSDMTVALPACAAGYTRTGSNCSGPESIASGYLIAVSATGCTYRNLSASSTYTATATSTCCRIP